MAEVPEDTAGNETEPLGSPANPDAAAVVLAKFGPNRGNGRFTSDIVKIW